MHTGQVQFPNIYVGSEHLGGLDDLLTAFSLDGLMNNILQRNDVPVTVDPKDYGMSSQSEQEEEPLQREVNLGPGQLTL